MLVERQLLHRTTCVHPASGAVAAGQRVERDLAAVGDEHVADALAAAPRGMPRASPPCPCSPCRLDHPRRVARVSRSIVCPVSSSTPDVPPAMTSRRAPSAEARCEASVSALTFRAGRRASRRCRPRPARSRARADRSAAAASRCRSASPTSPRSTFGPATAHHRRRSLHRRDRCIGAGQPDRAGRRLCARAATSRVLIAPASTATTTSSVRASVTRSPSTCCFGMPARCQRRVDLAAAAVHDDERRALRQRARSPWRSRSRSCRLLEQFAAELQHEPALRLCATAAITAGPSARRGQARC